MSSQLRLSFLFVRYGVSLAVVAVLLAITPSAHAGYPDGMNTYAGYHIMHGGVDPMGYSAEGTVEKQVRLKNGIMGYKIRPFAGQRGLIVQTHGPGLEVNIHFWPSVKCDRVRFIQMVRLKDEDGKVLEYEGDLNALHTKVEHEEAKQIWEAATRGIKIAPSIEEGYRLDLAQQELRRGINRRNPYYDHHARGEQQIGAFDDGAISDGKIDFTKVTPAVLTDWPKHKHFGTPFAQEFETCAVCSDNDPDEIGMGCFVLGCVKWGFVSDDGRSVPNLNPISTSDGASKTWIQALLRHHAYNLPK